MASDHMPADFLLDIFMRLPVKTLVRFTCVCKQWKSLISSPLFITRHFNFITSTTYLQIKPAQTGWYTYDDMYTLNHPDNTTTPLQVSLPGQVTPLGVIHGVVALKYPQNIVFWNPTISKYVSTPDVPKSEFCELIGVGFDSSKNDFKAVLWSHEMDYYKVLSLREGTWRKKTMPKYVSSDLYYAHLGCRGCFLEGIIYWLTSTDLRVDRSGDDLRNTMLEGQGGRGRPHGLILFDCVNEEFGRMELPEQVWDEFGCPRLFIYHGLLSVVTREPNKEQLGLWTMKEFGVWSKDVIEWADQYKEYHYIGRGRVFRESMWLLDIGKDCADMKNNITRRM